jgi:mRNA-degrading endonuclease RelE of RelBE toxin-antitoxin system
MLLEDPKCVGKTLTGNMRICLRYRTGDSRLIYELKNNCLIVVAVMVSGCK